MNDLKKFLTLVSDIIVQLPRYIKLLAKFIYYRFQLASFLLIALLTLFFSVKYILSHNYFYGQAGEALPSRSTYYKRDEFTVYLDNLEIPTYLQDKSGIELIYLDVALVTSNRYLKKHIQKNKVEIIDVIIRSLHQSSSPFILSDEGKNILLAKIQRSLNKHFQENGPQGEIVQIYINNIKGMAPHEI